MISNTSSGCRVKLSSESFFNSLKQREMQLLNLKYIKNFKFSRFQGKYVDVIRKNKSLSRQHIVLHRSKSFANLKIHCLLGVHVRKSLKIKTILICDVCVYSSVTLSSCKKSLKLQTFLIPFI